MTVVAREGRDAEWLVSLPMVLQDVVLGYLAPEELYIYDKVASLAQHHTRYWKSVTAKDALRYAAKTGWLQGLAVLQKDKLDAYHAHLLLRHAAAGGQVDAMAWIAQKKGSPITLNAANRAMNEAARGGHVDAIEWLVSTAGADAFSTAMDEAAAGGHLAAMEWLARKNTSLRYALVTAALMGQVAAMEWMARTYSEPFTLEQYNEAFLAAAKGGHIAAMEWCVARGANDWNQALVYATAADATTWLRAKGGIIVNK